MKRSKRKTRSDKFPLTLHPTGQYCKKIKGKIRYFGTDKKQALESGKKRAFCFVSFTLFPLFGLRVIRKSPTSSTVHRLVTGRIS